MTGVMAAEAVTAVVAAAEPVDTVTEYTHTIQESPKAATHTAVEAPAVADMAASLQETVVSKELMV